MDFVPVFVSLVTFPSSSLLADFLALFLTFLFNCTDHRYGSNSDHGVCVLFAIRFGFS